MRAEFDLLVLLEEPSFIKWDEVRRLDEEQKILDGGHVLCCRGKPQGSKQESGVDFLVHKRLEKNMVGFHSESKRGASVIRKMNIRYDLKIVQVLCPDLQPW